MKQHRGRWWMGVALVFIGAAVCADVLLGRKCSHTAPQVSPPGRPAVPSPAPAPQRVAAASPAAEPQPTAAEPPPATPTPTGNAMSHPPVPDAWLLARHQDVADPRILDRDTDGDGFTTLDEWRAHTDPGNKEDHPPYYTKLFLNRYVRLPFPVVFEALNGEVMLITVLGTEDPPTLFLKVGDLVEGTKLKITKLDHKTGKSGGIIRDQSEVTLVNTETGQTVVLLRPDEDHPSVYAELLYTWSGKEAPSRTIITLVINQEFSIEPDTNVKYKFLNYSDPGVKVLKEDENKIVILNPLPAS